jgi:cytochrome b
MSIGLIVLIVLVILLLGGFSGTAAARFTARAIMVAAV